MDELIFSRFKMSFTEKIRKSLAKVLKDLQEVDIVIGRFWDVDGYNSILRNREFAKRLVIFVSKNGTDFTRREFYEHLYLPKELKQSELLQKIAFKMEQQQVNRLTTKELESLLKKLGAHEQLLESAISIKPTGGGLLFRHNTIQEYFAAKYLEKQKNTNLSFKENVFLKVNDSIVIKPSWYGVVRFLLEGKFASRLLEEIINVVEEFPDNIEENFSDFITSCELAVGDSLVHKLYDLIVSSYKKKSVWLPVWASQNLWKLAHPKAILEIKETFQRGITNETEAIFIGNLISVLDGLLGSKSRLIGDSKDWKGFLLDFAQEESGFGVVQRNAMHALRVYKGDVEILTELRSVIDSKSQLAREALIDLASEVAPNSKLTLELIAKGFESGHTVSPRYCLYNLSNEDGVAHLFQQLIDKDGFRREFFEGESVFAANKKRGDEKLLSIIKEHLSEELLLTLKNFIWKAYTSAESYLYRKSPFIREVVRFIHANDSDYIDSLISRISSSENPSKLMYQFEPVLVLLFTRTNYKDLFDKINKITSEKGNIGKQIIQRLSYRDEEGRKIFEEALKENLIETYTPGADDKPAIKNQERILRSFRKKLKPKSKTFSSDVFDYYVTNHKHLESVISDKEIARLKELMFDTVFSIWDTRKIVVKYQDRIVDSGSNTYTITSFSPIFGSALEAAALLLEPEDVHKYRANIISYIPFAYSETRKAIVKLLGKIGDDELKEVNTIYLDSSSNKRFFMPTSYIYIMSAFISKGSVLPSVEKVYLKLINDEEVDGYARIEAISKLIEVFSNKDKGLFTGIFERYSNSKNKYELRLSEIANKYLITEWEDKRAIEWRIGQIISRTSEFEQPKKMHRISRFESELHDMDFAGPIISLSFIHINEITKLLELSIKLNRKGFTYDSYANYLRNVAQAFFLGLEDANLEEALRVLERIVQKNKDKEKINRMLWMYEKVRVNYLMRLSVYKAVRKGDEA